MAVSVEDTPPPARPQIVNGRAAVVAGIVGSLVFQLLEILLIPHAGGGSPWGPARMIAAIVMGREVLPPPATFNLTIVSVAFLVDIVLAIVYAHIIGALIQRWKSSTGIIVGALSGAILYGLNFYVFTSVFPWFVMGRNLVTLCTHLIFSVTVVIVYLRLSRERSI